MASHFRRSFSMFLTSILLFSLGMFVAASGEEAKPKAAKSELSSSQASDIARFKKAHALFLNFFKLKLYKEAEVEVETALKLARKLLGNKHLVTASQINNLAVLYTSTRRYKHAVPLYEEALAIRKALLPPNDKRILGTLEDLQTALLAIGQPAKETKILLQLVELYGGTPPKNAKRLAFALDRLGVIEINAGEYGGAIVKIKRAININETVLGRRHKTTIMSISNRAVIYTKQKDYKAAITLFDEVYQARKILLGPDHPLTLQTMTELSEIASSLKQYDRAILLAKQLISLNEAKLGVDDISLAGKHNRLSAYAYRAKDFDLAGRALVRAIEITEKKEGKDSPQLLVHLRNLATLYEDLGRYEAAVPVYARRLEILIKKEGESATKVIHAMIFLGQLNRQIARFKKAETLMKTALKREQARSKPKKTTLSAVYSNLGGLYRETGRYGESGAAYKKALAFHLDASNAKPINLGRLYDNLGVLNIEIEKFDVAEKFHKKALALFEENLGPEHRTVSLALNNLAAVYGYQGRTGEAIKLQERGIAIYLKPARPSDPQIGVFYDNLAGSYRIAKRFVAAEKTYKLAMDALLKAYGPRHPQVALAMSNLAALYGNRKDYIGAEKLFRKAIAINQKAFGENHPMLANIWRLLGENDFARQDYVASERHYKKALEISIKANGRDHIKTGYIHYQMGKLYLWQQNYLVALANYRRAARIEELQLIHKQEGKNDAKGGGRRGVFSGLAITSWHVASNKDLLQKTGSNRDALMEQGLHAAQKALRTSAGAALAQMSARFAAGSGQLASNVRHRQYLTRRYTKLDSKLASLVGATSKSRDGAAIKRLRVSLIEVGDKIKSLDQKLAAQFPEYASLANPQPLTGSDVQKQLQGDEALIYFMTSNQAVYIWALTNTQFAWHRVPLKRSELRKQVAHLRLSLNPLTAGTRGFASNAQPALEVKVKTSFDLDASHKLYKDLLQPLEDVIGSKKHLIIIASDALTGLPFQVLITDPPTSGAPGESQIYREASWLIKKYALTTLPSIASLKALRQFAGKSDSPPKALIGFGDPVFSQQKKPIARVSNTAGFASFYRGGQVNLAALSQLSQLPDTRDELINVAKTLNVPLGDIKLGRGASEAIVKQLNKSGELARHKIVYFATHGLISGDIKGLGEPALALSVPQKATTIDDGLLTASEVTQLHLNADWVVLSACNTASGDKPGAEALSGLAQAFFYAGAKSLLVSHWPVYSDAATLLTTKAFKYIDEGQTAGQPVGRAEALRLAMLWVLQKKDDDLASHPSYWAPFVVVGEGAVVQ